MVMSTSRRSKRHCMRLHWASLICCLVFAVISISMLAQTSAKPEEDDRGSIAWFVRQAKQRGEISVTLPDAIYEYAEFNSLDDALRRTSATVGKVVATAVTADEYRITTWRKYRRIESLSMVPVYPRRPGDIDNLPASLLPLGKDEFLVPSAGGTVRVDGVEVTEKAEGLGDAPADHPHLMFLLFIGPGGMLAISNYGPEGLWIDDADKIRVAGRPSTLAYDEIVRRTGGDLAKLRALAQGVENETKDEHSLR